MTSERNIRGVDSHVGKRERKSNIDVLTLLLVSGPEGVAVVA